jgi:F420-dependent oxidoreductase-like protein
VSLTYSLFLPQGFLLELAGIPDPVEAYETLTRVAQTAEECGFASVWLVDHLHTAQPSQEALFECWTTTAALARDTKRVRIGQLVTVNHFRHPALLAKMASTIDVLSHGRLTLGIGAGCNEHEARAYGYDTPEAPVRLRQLREAVQVMRAMWQEEEATFEGQYYQVREAINQPNGVQQPHIPLLIGGDGEKVTLKVVAQYADACNVFGDPATVAHKFAVLKQHCESVGRDYTGIHRTAWTFCSIGETDEQAQELLSERTKALFADVLPFALIGSPETIRQGLAAYEAAGVQELALHFADVTHLEAIRRFARAFIREKETFS